MKSHLIFPKETSMKKLLTPIAGLCAFGLLLSFAATSNGADKVPPVLNFEMQSLDGKPVNLSKYAGKVVLMVNVASRCGATPQYKQLEELHEKYGAQGLSV